MLRRFGVYLTGDPELARELAQETIRVFLSKEPPGLSEAMNLEEAGKWLRGIMRNLARNQDRKRYRSRLVFDSEMLEAAERRFVETGSQHEEVWQARKAALAGCLEKLPGQDRELVRRRYEQGHPVKMLAETLHLEANTLSKRLERVRRTLRECVERGLKGEVHG